MTAKTNLTLDTLTPRKLAKEAGLTPTRIYQLLDAGILAAQRREVTRTEYTIPRVIADAFIVSRRAVRRA